MNKKLAKLLAAVRGSSPESLGDDECANDLSAYELEARVLYSATPLELVEQAPEAVDLGEPTENAVPQFQMAAMSATYTEFDLLISTVGNASGSTDNFDDSEAEKLSDPNLALGSSTDGTMTSFFDLRSNGFTDPLDDVRLRGLHFVQHDFTLGTGADSFDLQYGDLVFGTSGNGVLTGNTTSVATDDDLYLFRPAAPGDFTSGEFYYLIDNPLPVSFGGLTLVDKPGGIDMPNGDHFDQGTFMLGGTVLGFDAISYFAPDTTGEGTTSGTSGLVALGVTASISLNQPVDALQVIQSNVTIGGMDFEEGDIFFSLAYADSAVGSPSVSVQAQDVGLLRFDSGSGAEGFMVIDGSDLALTTADESINAIALQPTNTSPIEISIDNLQVDENTPTSSGLSIGALSAIDWEGGPFTFEVVGTSPFSIASGNQLVVTGVNLDYETTSSYTVTVRVTDSGSLSYETELTISVNDVNEAPAVQLQNVIPSIPENTTAQTKVADIVIVDDALGSETLSLAGIDAGKFEIVGSEIFLRANAGVDFETNPDLEFTVRVDDTSIGTTFDGFVDHVFALTDINEAPSIALDNVVPAVFENHDTSARTKVADIVVTDDGLGSETLSVAGSDSGLFEVIGTELFLRAGVALDFESKPLLSITVRVDDPSIGSTIEDSVSFSLGVADSNEAPSIFLDNVYSSLPEDTDTSSRIKVADILISDDALGDENFLLSGSDASKFEVVGLELFLSAGVSLDFETLPILNVRVEVDDPDIGTGIEGFSDFTLPVSDVNEAPTVALLNTVDVLPENFDTTARTKVADIQVTDDALGSESFALSGTDASLFEVLGTELYLRAGVSLDFEFDTTLEVTVEVDDATLGSTYEDSVAFSLSVQDVNEAPAVTLTNKVFSVPEGNSAQTKIADITVSDDALGSETLGLSGTDAALFEIIGSELYLRSGAILDYETQPSLSVIVTVDDATLGVTIEDSDSHVVNVTDVNEAPSIAVTGTVSTLPEDTDTTSRIKVADITIIDDALGSETITLSGPDASLFEVVGNELFLRAGASLDFETKSSLFVTLDIDDPSIGSTSEDSIDFLLPISDVNEAPTVTLLNTITLLDENSEFLNDLKVADIQINDDALGSETLTLSGTDSNLFEIVGSELFLKSGTTLDFETNPTLDVTIEVDDATIGITFEDSAAHVINVVDVNEAPSIQLTNRITDLDENTTVQTKIADIVITDDALGSETLVIDGTDANLFEIIGTELFLKAGQTIDFESRASLSVTVRVDDPTIGTSNEDSDFFSFDINDVNEAPSVSLSNSVLLIDENSNMSTRVKMADILVSDDALGSETLSLSGADSSDFEIIGNELFLRAGTTIDFETKTTFDVTIEVDDATLGSGSEDSTNFTLTVNDINEAPTISLPNSVIDRPETVDTSSAIKVTDIVITDDAMGTETLSLSGTDSAMFEIVGNELFLRAGTGLDFESNPQLNVTVSIDDPGIGTSAEDSADFTLNVLDVNEAPAVTLTNKLASVPEDTTAQTKVADIVVADDALGSENLTLSGLDASLFEIVGFELFLRATSGLDFESDFDLDVTVSVDDPTIGSNAEDSDSMILSVTDVNEAPSIALHNTISTIGEDADTSNPIKVADIQIIDDALGTETLSLSGVDSHLFEIIGTELFLKSGVTLDFEAQSQLNVTVEIDDSMLGTSFEDSFSLTIGVADTNEPPVVALTNAVNLIAENTISQTKIADIVVTDDGSGSQTLSVAGSDSAYFEIIGNELFLRANQRIDFETQSSLNISVAVDDPSIGTGAESQADHVILVTDVNEAPSVTLTNQVLVIAENTDTSGPTKVADIVVEDDALGSETISLSGVDSGNFEIIGSELFLKSGVDLDFESQASLNVVVAVDDSTLGSGIEDSVAFTLSVSDQNEAPAIALTNTVGSLPENFDTSSPTKIADIQIADDALGTETLSLSGRDTSLFEIIGTELFLKSNVSLDFESLADLQVTVEVDDPTIGSGVEDTASHVLSVLDVNELPAVTLVNKRAGVPEDTTSRTKIADIVITDDALGSESLSLSGADASLFEIVGTELFLRSGSSLDHETTATLEVTVSVDDPSIGSGTEDSDSHTLDVTDVNEAPVVANPIADIVATEDDSDLTLDLSNVFTDVDLDTLNLTLSNNSDPTIASAQIVGNSLVIDLLDDQFGDFTLDIVADDGEFSALDQFTVRVVSENDAPTLLGNGILPDVFRDSDPAGESVRDFADALFSDIDGDTLSGIAVIQNNATLAEGQWQYFDSTGDMWQNIGLSNEAAAVAISADTIVRFLPAAGFAGSPTPLEFVAIDSSYSGSFSGASTVQIDVSTAGGTTPYSLDSANLEIEVKQFGISITPTSSLVTTESGGTATFEVVLLGAPAGIVSVSVSSSDVSEGITSTMQLQFTPDDWSQPQTVTVTGVDERIDDGNQTYSINLSAADSSDLKYENLETEQVVLTNVDDDSAGIVVSTTQLFTSENGVEDEFVVRLNSQPTADVLVDLSVSDTAEAFLSATSILFTPDNWNTPQSISVTGENDFEDDGDTEFTISVTASSIDDAKFNALSPVSINASNLEFVGATVDNPNPFEAGTDVISKPAEESTDEADATTQLLLVPPPSADRNVVYDNARKAGSLINFQSKVLADLDLGDRFEANQYYRDIDSTDLFDDVYAEAKKLAMESAQLVREDDEAELQDLWSELDTLDNRIRNEAALPQIAVGTIASIASIFTAGYLAWLIRGGQLLLGLLSQLPAWTSLDMLAVLSKPEEESDEETESLETIISKPDDSDPQPLADEEQSKTQTASKAR
ncbi:hypothetical protein [Mariniblastus fucicola]|uniref:Cadherin domain protein n=1 Tax=Mariniblastus fucicola TaxID=980251 RepID=A0A5B9PID5_9BACT|nr:hypothetical protein [Mariniblastus fucicola]QEG22393.1 Cadherin domain protein [Mariniblastus fucicola]